jgi:hypothetical protein
VSAQCGGTEIHLVIGCRHQNGLTDALFLGQSGRCGGSVLVDSQCSGRGGDSVHVGASADLGDVCDRYGLPLRGLPEELRHIGIALENTSVRIALTTFGNEYKYENMNKNKANSKLAMLDDCKTLLERSEECLAGHLLGATRAGRDGLTDRVRHGGLVGGNCAAAAARGRGGGSGGRGDSVVISSRGGSNGNCGTNGRFAGCWSSIYR